MDAGKHLVIGAFQPFSGKHVNQADEVAKRLVKMRGNGELKVPVDVQLTVLPLDTNAAAVDHFVQQAQALHADRVLMLGEGGLGVHVEAQSHDRGQPGSLLASAAAELLPTFKKSPTLASPAPVEAMGCAGGAKVSHDAGHYYCNYSYHSALRAGLNAVFVHVPSGILGLGRDADGAAQSVNKMLGAWYQTDPDGPLVLEK